jgi:hypothetical protein
MCSAKLEDHLKGERNLQNGPHKNIHVHIDVSLGRKKTEIDS